MAGHSKWSNIKHKKAAQDAKRGKIFTRLIREITVAARLGGSDRDANPRLRIAVATALSNNMTKDTIERAIKKGVGGEEGADFEEVRYEGYGPSGIAFIVDCMTNNRNRTVAEVRHAFSRSGGNLGTTGSVGYMFHQKGLISFAPNSDEAAIMEAALEIGAEDVIVNSDASIDVITDPNRFVEIKEAFDQRAFDIISAQIILDADVEVPITGDELAEKVVNMIDRLEELEDVQQVYSNADFGNEKRD